MGRTAGFCGFYLHPLWAGARVFMGCDKTRYITQTYAP